MKRKLLYRTVVWIALLLISGTGYGQTLYQKGDSVYVSLDASQTKQIALMLVDGEENKELADSCFSMERAKDVQLQAQQELIGSLNTTVQEYRKTLDGYKRVVSVNQQSIAEYEKKIRNRNLALKIGGGVGALITGILIGLIIGK